ncbi:hypothetical protein [Cellulomonas soli]|uniref:hypothetical protein n=1 Tax=Cellulomonas soli TaxID=931535 RepID=UPI0011BE5467|nr:hypothetical protein [Cellulomonas soli]NYI57987.1 hypothetical protein [Cellulomonas soli]
MGPARPVRGILAAVGVLAALAGTAGCSPDDGAAADAAPTGLSWPTAVDPASTDGTLWVVWTDVAQDATVAGAELADTVEDLDALGYRTSPWEPTCQESAQEALGGLTGYEAPVGVGLAFSSAQDAGAFDTLCEGTTVTVTEGAYTCG